MQIRNNSSHILNVVFPQNNEFSRGLFDINALQQKKTELFLTTKNCMSEDKWLFQKVSLTIISVLKYT